MMADDPNLDASEDNSSEEEDNLDLRKSTSVTVKPTITYAILTLLLLSSLEQI